MVRIAMLQNSATEMNMKGAGKTSYTSVNLDVCDQFLKWLGSLSSKRG